LPSTTGKGVSGMKEPEVAICGNDQFIHDFVSYLSQVRRNQLIRLGSRLQDSVWDLNMTCPDVVVFEIGNGDEMPDNAFFRQYPQIRFIGIDLKNNFMISIFENERTAGKAADWEWKILNNT
jgi:hypothetical protein